MVAAWRRRLLLVFVAVGLALGVAACGPEGDRDRGGGPGADVGNRDTAVDLHGDEQPEDSIYYLTPKREPPE